jgi:hypothetical protein
MIELSIGQRRLRPAVLETRARPCPIRRATALLKNPVGGPYAASWKMIPSV